MHFPHNGKIVTLNQLTFIDNCTTFAHPTSLSVSNIRAVSLEPWVYYVASCLRNLIANEMETRFSCSTYLDLNLTLNLVSPSMGALESDLPPIDLSECSIQDVVLSFDEYLLEAMVSVDVTLDDISIVLSTDHIIELEYPAIELNPDLTIDFDLIIGESSKISVVEFSHSSIELQAHFNYESDILCRPLGSLNDEFVPIDSAIDVNYNLPIKIDLLVWRSSVLGVDEYLPLYSPRVMYTI